MELEISIHKFRGTKIRWHVHSLVRGASSVKEAFEKKQRVWTAVASEARHRFRTDTPRRKPKRRRRSALPAHSIDATCGADEARKWGQKDFGVAQLLIG